MQASDFDYHLPEHLIAQQPPPQRRGSRLLVADPREQSLVDRQFGELLDLVQPGDLVVFNDTRVIPARLRGHKQSGGRVEVLVERILDQRRILAQVRASKSPRSGSRLRLEQAIECEVLGRQDEFFVLRLESESDGAWLDQLQQYGHMPLPPYIQRGDADIDHERYQTVYAKHAGAVAAPTAGLHFDDAMLAEFRAKQVDIGFVTLHVGAGTFQPLRVEDISQHRMHAELVTVDERICQQIATAKKNRGRVIAVGTTVVRSLESAALEHGLQPYEGDTRLFITPGFSFRVVDALLTNFHLPRSTLLMLVSAFAGREFMLQAYHHAVEQEYRFFSYGDAMFITNRRA